MDVDLQVSKALMKSDLSLSPPRHIDYDVEMPLIPFVGLGSV